MEQVLIARRLLPYTCCVCVSQMAGFSLTQASLESQKNSLSHRTHHTFLVSQMTGFVTPHPPNMPCVSQMTGFVPPHPPNIPCVSQITGLSHPTHQASPVCPRCPVCPTTPTKHPLCVPDDRFVPSHPPGIPGDRPVSVPRQLAVSVAVGVIRYPSTHLSSTPILARRCL